MDDFGYFVDGILAGLCLCGGGQAASLHNVVHASMQLGHAIDMPKSQDKSALVTLAAVGLGAAVLNSVIESRKGYYYA